MLYLFTASANQISGCSGRSQRLPLHRGIQTDSSEAGYPRSQQLASWTMEPKDGTDQGNDRCLEGGERSHNIEDKIMGQIKVSPFFDYILNHRTDASKIPPLSKVLPLSFEQIS